MSRLERQRKEGHNYPIYAVKIDLDYFKNINDSFGHAAGNLYLKKVSEHLRRALFRKTDILARVGGDEFTVLMPDLDAEHVEQVKERLLEAVLSGSTEAKAELGRERGRELAAEEGNVSASMGFELFDGHETPEELLEHADYYSYMAKTAGKNAVVGREMAAELDPDGKIRQSFITARNSGGEIPK
jgi:diguanylate cyclase (GGDEF)-like protein